MDNQKRMEAYLERTMIENNVDQKDSINGMMQSVNWGCSYEDKTLSLGFPVQKWQVNRAKMLHGGIICTAFDITIAALARFCSGQNYAPTISLDIKYIRPLKLGDTMIIKARATASGKRIIQLVCEAYSKDSGKLVATGASVYINADTTREEHKNNEEKIIQVD